MVLKWTRTKPEPLKYFEQDLNLNPNLYLKQFDTLVKTARLQNYTRTVDVDDCGVNRIEFMSDVICLWGRTYDITP